MKAVVQRVSRGSVKIDGQIVGEIERGLLVLLGIGKDDAAADADWMVKKLLALRLPPTVALELAIAGDDSPLKLRGCGLAVINPPWRFERIAGPLLAELARLLAQGPGGGGRVRWLVPEL